MIRRLLALALLSPLGAAQMLDLDPPAPIAGEGSALLSLAEELEASIPAAEGGEDADAHAARSARAGWRLAAIALLRASALREPPDAAPAADALRIAREGRTLDALARSLLTLEDERSHRVRASLAAFGRAAARFDPRTALDRAALDALMTDLFSRLHTAVEAAEGVDVEGGWLAGPGAPPIPSTRLAALIDESGMPDGAKAAAHDRLAVLLDAQSFPHLRRDARSAALALAAAIELPVAAAGTRHLQVSPSRLLEEVQRACALAADPASAERGARLLRGLARSRTLIARTDALLGPGPSLGALRTQLAPLLEAADRLARDPAPERDVPRVLDAITELLDTLLLHRARRAQEEPARDLRLAWRVSGEDVERAASHLARALLDAATSPTAIDRPATVSAITEFRRAIEAERRILRITDLAASIESLGPPDASGAALRGLWLLIEQHADEERRPWASRQLARLERQLTRYALVPEPYAGPALVSSRAAWLRAWEDGDPEEMLRELELWSKLAHLRMDAEECLAAADEWPLRRWSACAIEPVDLHPIASRLRDALDESERALSAMQPSERAEALERLERDGLLVRVAAALARAVAQRTAHVPLASRAVGRLSIPPPEDAFLIDRRADLDELTCLSIELARAERERDAALADSVIQRISAPARRVLDALERAEP